MGLGIWLESRRGIEVVSIRDFRIEVRKKREWSGAAYSEVSFRRTETGVKVAFRIAGLISDNGLPTMAAAATLAKADNNKVNAPKNNISLSVHLASGVSQEGGIVFTRRWRQVEASIFTCDLR